MRRLIFVTQRIDPEHANLAAATAMVRALAERVDEVVVIALHAVPDALPENCTVHEIGASRRALRGLAYQRALAASLRPRPLGIPIVLWFTHWRASGLLRLAERVSNRVVTVARGSFPLPSGKVVPIGHGIDVTQFACRTRDDDSTFRVLALGRTSPAKGLDAIARGVALVRERVVDAELEVRGPS